MGWQERLKEAAYNSPSGKRVVFDFEDVKKIITKKTAAYDFPDVDGTYIQDSGHSGRRIPLRLFFWGDNYDTASEEFEQLLLERGKGIIEHPIYGTIDVVPFGEIGRRDDLKTAANQAIFEVTFFETIGLIYPSTQGDPASQIQTGIEDLNEKAATNYQDNLTLDTAIERVTVENDNLALVATVNEALKTVAATDSEINQQFSAITSSINNSIDVLITQPLSLAFQSSLMIQAPARALTSIQARLEAYGNLAQQIIANNTHKSNNDFRTKDLYASAYVTGSILSTINHQFATKNEALEAAAQVLTQFEQLTAWRDASFANIDQIDTGETYQQLLDVVSLTAGFLVELSFSLKQEHRIILDRDRAIIDLAAELYGEVDNQLDFLIISNDLSGDEIFEIKMGREIVYYI